MKKKGIIILCSVIALCAIGLVSSHFIDWPVDLNDADGDIAKAAKFSREQASEKLTNMEELLQTDSAFKDGIVAAQVVMQTRAIQFASLVDMSYEVAGDIPAYADVLKDMKASLEVVTNANNSLAEAVGDLNAALEGKECPDLEQNTINGAMAYTTLQKQNKLANRFIEVTDKYLETAQGNDRLKFVRDQWLEYQQMTAALEGNKENAEALAKKGNLLSGEKALAAVASFNLAQQMSIYNNCYMVQSMHVDTQLSNAIPSDALGQLVSSIRSAAGITMQQVAANDALNQTQVEKIFSQAVLESVKSVASDAIGSRLINGLQSANQQNLAQVNKDALGMIYSSALIITQTAQMVSAVNVMSAYSNVVVNGALILEQNQSIGLGQSIGNAIKETSLGNKPTLGARIPW